jgi:hypothetical protein
MIATRCGESPCWLLLIVWETSREDVCRKRGTKAIVRLIATCSKAHTRKQTDRRENAGNAVFRCTRVWLVLSAWYGERQPQAMKTGTNVNVPSADSPQNLMIIMEVIVSATLLKSYRYVSCDGYCENVMQIPISMIQKSKDFEWSSWIHSLALVLVVHRVKKAGGQTWRERDHEW